MNKENLLSTRVYEQVKDRRDDLSQLNLCFRAANEFAATGKSWDEFEVQNDDEQ